MNSVIREGVTVDPWIAEDCCAFWQTELGYLGLYSFILQCDLLDQQDFLPVARTVDIGAQANIALYSLLGQVDNGLVKFILMPCQ